MTVPSSLWGCFHAHLPVLVELSVISCVVSSIFALTKVTYPSSTSSFWSSNSKQRVAPAIAIIDVLICIEIWLKLFANCLDIVKKETTTPISRGLMPVKLKFGTPKTTKNVPIIAIAT